MPQSYRGTKEYFLIFAELINAARHRGAVTYQELADLIGLPLKGSHMGTELGEYLGAISEDEVKLYEGPMLSAITVTVAGRPGEGFFGLAKDLGKLQSDDATEREVFWQAEKRAVYETWQRSFAKRTHQE